MGGLAHFLEQEGLSTTQISLIREHTETIKPPRALWVPFELGRPLGAPNDTPLQERVLTAALKLLEAKSGPVLEDFPESVPRTEEGSVQWACPVRFAPPRQKESTEGQGLGAALKEEMARLLPWYDLAVRERGRTTVALSGLEPEALGDFVLSFLEGAPHEQSPRKDLSVPMALKAATEDLKAFYFEAVTAKPGGAATGSGELSDWFWSETAAGRVLMAVQKRCAESKDRMLKVVAKLLLIPVDRMGA